MNPKEYCKSITTIQRTMIGKGIRDHLSKEIEKESGEGMNQNKNM